ncbi:Crp/Fnr family transcriptional regulator [Streptosporangium sp. KLBMP 9127]|nr:Crp/Fnr family transcriptional regulator [Streptosporangium sp. KLBMP 9127]
MKRRYKFWQQLSLEGRTALRKAGVEVTTYRGDDLFSAKDPKLVIPLSDSWVRLEIESGPDKHTVLDIAGPGDLVNALHAVEPIGPPWLGEAGIPRGITIQKGRALIIPTKAISEILKRDELREAIIRAIGTQLHMAQQLHAATGSLDVRPRLARILLIMLYRFGERKAIGKEYILAPPLSQDTLASWAAASPTSVARVFRQWRTANLVKTSYASVSILDVKRLGDETYTSDTSYWKPPAWG